MAWFRFRRGFRAEIVATLWLPLFLLLGQAGFAQDHVVAPTQIQSDVAASTSSRQANLAQVDDFFSSEPARHALKSANIGYEQVHNALRMLSDQELANISARTQQAQRDFAAGSVTDIELLFIVLAVVVIVLVIAIH